MLALFGVARRLLVFNCVDTVGRARGLSGAPAGARGRRPSPEDLHRLDPDGWLVQSATDTNSIESPAEQRRTRGAYEKSVTPQPRGSRSSFPISLCLLDKRLLMGGTFPRPSGARCPCSSFPSRCGMRPPPTTEGASQLGDCAPSNAETSSSGIASAACPSRPVTVVARRIEL